MDVQEVLGGESGATKAAGKSHRPVILSPGVGVVGALVNAQLGSILWAIVDKYLLVLQDVLGGPINNHRLPHSFHSQQGQRQDFKGFALCPI